MRKSKTMLSPYGHRFPVLWREEKFSQGKRKEMRSMEYTGEEIRRTLREMSEEEYRKFNAGLLPGVSNILGVRIPKLRKLAQKMVRKDWEQWLKEAEDTIYEEKMLQGLVIGYADMELEKRLSYIRKFVPKIDNWAVCDTFCGTLKCTQNYKKEIWEFLDPYVKSGDEYQERFAAVMLLEYYVEEEYLEKALARLSLLQSEGYYSKMAAAWALSVYFVKFPQRVMEYLEGIPRDTFVYKKTLQKILESYRVDRQWKTKIRQMRQKG